MGNWASAIVFVGAGLVACGRIGFDSRIEDAPGDGVLGGDGMSSSDALASCVYSSLCGLNEIMCCTGSTSVCQPVGQACSGEVATCNVTTHEGCTGSALCCGAGPYPSCFDPPPC